MPTGAITGYIDVAQIVLYGFWIFFFGLIYYLRREDKREGYPLQSDRSDRAPRIKLVGFPAMPDTKTFLLPHDQGTRPSPPDDEPPLGDIAGTTVEAPWNGTPLIPTGNPMRDGVGPASHAPREDAPDLTIEGRPKVIPMRLAEGFSPDPSDPDPRGMDVVAADGQVAGQVKDLWVDLTEPRILYFEVELPGGRTEGVTNPLLPIGFSRVRFGRRQILVGSIMADQFADVPRTASPDQVTRLEEDRICAYYGGGHLYAAPSRQEPLI
ncbi:MAG: photosynthetic reaction center subunit H [Wenzhouxiangellaceae bacterium]